MKLYIKVRTSAKTAKIIQIDENHLDVWLIQPAKDGKANSAIIKALSIYFKVAQNQIKIVSGKKYKNKIIEIIVGIVCTK